MMRNLSGTNVASFSCRQISMVFVRDDPKLPKNIKGQRRYSKSNGVVGSLVLAREIFFLFDGDTSQVAIAPPLLA